MSDPVLPPPGVRQRGYEPTGARLVIIRHGECHANALGIAGGPKGDGGLTTTGRLQARALANRLLQTRELADVTALYASTLPRAMETAGIISPSLPSHLTWEFRDDLAELSVGEADGMTWGDYAERYRDVDWDRDPTTPIAPGGDSLISFFERVRGALSNLAQRHVGERVVIVAHGGVIEQAMKLYLGQAATHRLGLRSEHCSISEFEVADDQWRLLRYNDLSPLA